MRITTLSLTSMVLLAALGMAQNAGEPASEAPKKARVEGVVVGSDGAPIAGALVRMRGAPSVQNGALVQGANYTATTGDGGEFVLEDVEPAGGYSLQATKTGYVTARYGARTANASAVSLTLKAGDVLRGVTLRMAQQGAISGQVVDSNGDPVQGARVRIQRLGYEHGVRQLIATGVSAVSDEQGVFRVPSLAAGRYYVSAATSRPPDVNVTEAPLPTYYPNAAAAERATVLDVAEGQEVGNLELRMRRGRIYTVNGKVADDSGAPVAKVTVIALSSNGTSAVENDAQMMSQTTGDDGKFILRGMAPGAYQLMLIKNLVGPSPERGVAMLEVTDQNAAEVVVQFENGSVSGTVRLDQGDLAQLIPPIEKTAISANAIEAAVVGVLGSAGHPAVNLVAGGTSTETPLAGVSRALVNRDGTFTISGIRAGEYHLDIDALPTGTYLKSVQFGGSDVTHAPIEVAAGSGASLDILLGKNAAKVAGSVANEKGEVQTGVTAALWTGDAQPGSADHGVRTGITDRNGNVEFSNLAPGVYYLAAFENIDSGLAEVRDFLTQLNGDATKIELQEGSSPSEELKMIPVAKIKAAEEKLP